MLHIFLLYFGVKFNLFMYFYRLNSIDVKYQMWKLGVVFTDNVSLSVYVYIDTYICVYIHLLKSNILLLTQSASKGNRRYSGLYLIYYIDEENLGSLKRHCQNLFPITEVLVYRTSGNSQPTSDMLYSGPISKHCAVELEN